MPVQLSTVPFQFQFAIASMYHDDLRFLPHIKMHVHVHDFLLLVQQNKFNISFFVKLIDKLLKGCAAISETQC